jgi:microcystin-dependent protein
MSQPFLGEIRIVPYNFAPRGWAFCSGQIFSIAQNTALFALLGTTYGGNGQTTFALPNLQSRAAVSFGDGGATGAGNYSLGQTDGQEAVTLIAAEMPAHLHQANARAAGADASEPSSDTVWATSTTALYATQVPAQPTTGATAGSMAGDALAVSGGSQPHPNQPPLLALNYVIAVEGIFPSRN